MTSPDVALGARGESQQGHYGHGHAHHQSNSTGAVWQGQGVPNPASSPIPPGFVGNQAAAPPGFKSKSTEPNNSKAASGLSINEAVDTRGGVLQGPSSALSAEMAQASGGRTSSFVNLAAVFGTGLAESMDDALDGDAQQQQQHHGNNNHAQDHLSFARQSRHAMARRLIGSPPRVDNLGWDIGGGLIGSGSAAPTSLGAGLHINQDLHLTSSTSPKQQQQQHGGGANHGLQIKTNNNDFQGGGFLPGTYNEDAFGKPDQNILRRDLSPLSMFGPNAVRRGQLPVSKDLGVTVMEPDQRRDVSGSASAGFAGDSGGVLAALMQEQQQEYCNDPQCQQQPRAQQTLYEQQKPFGAGGNNPTTDTYELERGMRNLWRDDDASLGQASRQSASRQLNQPPQSHMDRALNSNNDTRSAGSQSSRKVAEAELRPFLWDTRVPEHQMIFRGGGGQQQQQSSVEPSRCLAILRAASLQIPDVRSTCEAFGVIDTFRSDFADRGIIFVSYYDMRSAQYAALDLEAVLKRRENDRGGGGNSSREDVRVYYCVPLNSSAQTDESRLVLSDVPPYVDEHSLISMLSSYGAVRSLKRHGGYYGGSSFEVEFHNVQDSKQALLELSSTQPWGTDVAVEVAMRQPIDRKRGRELLAVIGRWRHGPKSNLSPTASMARPFDAPSQLGHGAILYRGAESSTSSSPAVAAPTEMTQLVLGPDGRYSYMIVNNQSGFPQPSSNDFNNPYRRNQQHQDHMEPQRQQIVHGPNGEIYITTLAVPASPHANYRQGGPHSSLDYWQSPSQHQNQSHYSNASYHSSDSRDRLDRISGPYYPHSNHGMSSHHPDHHSHGGMHHNHHNHHHHHPHHSSNASNASVEGGDKDNKHLVLDLEAVENGRDGRTSLMVRNIPNKYTQQMLLAEFTENGLGPGVIDFFYLPIDFKNRCNRGYAFINFVDFKDILPFHRRYFGKHWSTFNSDKICDITYARIQGKAAMLKRFENSALMEKDEEYKPLVFISHGPEKGKRIPFPEAAASHHHRS